MFCNTIIVQTIIAQTTNLHQLINQITTSTPPSNFYFIAQAHNNQANVPLEQALLFALNQKYNITYDILEHGHSTAMILNEYLQYGNDSILKTIDPDASFSFIRSIKRYNDSSQAGKIKFYGIDFEGRQNDQYLKKAIEIVVHRTNVSDELRQLLTSIIDNRSDIEKKLQQLKTYLTSNESACREQLRNYYTDLLLITHAQYGFSPRRDEAMYQNFKLLYNELTKSNSTPKFIASFGFAHLSPANHQGIAYKLQNANDSPIRNKICSIGIEYYSSSFGKENNLKQWGGNLSLLCKNKFRNSLLKRMQNGQQLIFIPQNELSQLSCSPGISSLNGVILVCNWGNTSHYTWE